jgi:CDP-ribitol ribitolphosphotransferase / teichoic acid ribitol-phosphate polymerase
MKKAIVFLGMLIFKLIYFFIKLLPIRNKVTFISRQSDEPGLDFLLLVEEIKRRSPETETVILSKRLKKNLKDAIGYIIHMLVQVYHIATSKAVVLDSYCIAASNLSHKRKTKIIQIWHALGCLKKFGYSILDKKEGSSSNTAKMMNMHRNYDYVLSSTDLAIPHYSEAFNIEREKIVVIPLPRVDVCLEEDRMSVIREKIYSDYPKLKGAKENILYVPTFRKDRRIDYSAFVDAIDFTRYNLIIKLHSGYEEVYTNRNKAKKGRSYTGFEFLTVADYVVSDYSAIVFEAAMMKKPVFLYVYDYDEYNVNRGLYIDFKAEMPGVISSDIREIVKSIEEKRFDMERLDRFAKKYVVTTDKRSTERIVDLIFS